ncbi:MAG: hypothetical protein SNF33_07525 [Candidatus Algichlamydia australiensis]|nr:hypothetical protein [Chlamydiales bacterium]
MRERQIRKLYPELPAFAALDRKLKRAYRYRNSFAIARKFHGTPCYGETPLPILKNIAKRCGLKKEDHLFELGAGRGRGAFFINSLTGCQVTAVEIVPTFVEIGKELAPSSVNFIQEDFLDCDFSEATCIYLSGTMLTRDTIRRLCKKLQNSKAKIISVSYPLKAYDSRFTTLSSWEEKFPWGKTKLYLQKSST